MALPQPLYPGGQRGEGQKGPPGSTAAAFHEIDRGLMPVKRREPPFREGQSVSFGERALLAAMEARADAAADAAPAAPGDVSAVGLTMTERQKAGLEPVDHRLAKIKGDWVWKPVLKAGFWGKPPEEEVETRSLELRTTQFLLAAQCGDAAECQQFVHGGVDVDSAVNPSGQTAIHLAAAGGHHKCVSALIFLGGQVNARAESGATPLFLASKQGRVAALKRLLQEDGCEVNTGLSADGTSPLYVASLKGHVPIVKLLVAAGAEVDQPRTDTGATPLFAAAQANQAAVVRELVGAGAGVDRSRHLVDDASALFVVAAQAHREVLMVLLAAGAEVNRTTDDASQRLTALHVAARLGHLKVVRALLASGADFLQPDKLGSTPLHAACRCGQLRVVNELIAAHPHESREEKFAKQRYLNRKTEAGKTPIALACKNGHLAVIKTLVDTTLVDVRTVVEGGAGPSPFSNSSELWRRRRWRWGGDSAACLVGMRMQLFM